MCLKFKRTATRSTVSGKRPREALNKSSGKQAPWIGMGCEARTAVIANAIARICNAADHPSRRMHAARDLFRASLDHTPKLCCFHIRLELSKISVQIWPAGDFCTAVLVDSVLEDSYENVVIHPNTYLPCNCRPGHLRDRGVYITSAPGWPPGVVCDFP